MASTDALPQTTTTTSAAPVPTDDLATKIKKQVEFYFGDSNFQNDKHLQIQVKLNPEGCILVHILSILSASYSYLQYAGFAQN